MMKQLKIINHNALHWRERKFGLTPYYKSIDLDIILINIYGMRNNEPIKNHGYIIHKRKESNSPTNGTVITIKSEFPYRILENFISDTLGAEATTSAGKIIVATQY